MPRRAPALVCFLRVGYGLGTGRLGGDQGIDLAADDLVLTVAEQLLEARITGDDVLLDDVLV